MGASQIPQWREDGEILVIDGAPDERYEVAIPVLHKGVEAFLCDWHHGLDAAIAYARTIGRGTRVFPARLRGGS